MKSWIEKTSSVRFSTLSLTWSADDGEPHCAADWHLWLLSTCVLVFTSVPWCLHVATILFRGYLHSISINLFILWFFSLLYEGRPCVDCHAFEFMQRALQDLKKTAFNLDARVSHVPTRPCHFTARSTGHTLLIRHAVKVSNAHQSTCRWVFYATITEDWDFVLDNMALKKNTKP